MRLPILIIVLILLFISITAITSALTIDMKDSYQAKETILIKISGVSDTIKPEQVAFYRKHVQVPVFYDVAKFKDEYFIYAIAPKKQINYTLAIKDVKYIKDGKTIKEDILKNFSISGNASFSVQPGFVMVKSNKKEFSVYVENHKSDALSISTKFYTDKTHILSPGQKKKIFFPIQEVDVLTIKNLKISEEKAEAENKSSNDTLDIIILSYEIPVMIIPSAAQPGLPGETPDDEKKLTEFRFNPRNINMTVIKNEKYSLRLYLINSGQINIENITISFSKEFKNVLTVQPSFISLLEPGELKLNLTIKTKKEITGEKIEAKVVDIDDTNLSAICFVNIKLTKNISEVKYTGPVEDERCFDIGEICSFGQICDGEIRPTIDGSCCVGTCKEEPKKKSKIWIGVILLAVIVIFVVFLFLKSKKRKKVDILEEKTKKFEEERKPKLKESK